MVYCGTSAKTPFVLTPSGSCQGAAPPRTLPVRSDAGAPRHVITIIIIIIIITIIITTITNYYYIVIVTIIIIQ